MHQTLLRVDESTGEHRRSQGGSRGLTDSSSVEHVRTSTLAEAAGGATTHALGDSADDVVEAPLIQAKRLHGFDLSPRIGGVA